MPQEVRGCTQEGVTSLVGTVKALADSLVSKMLASDVPLPTVTARVLVFPLAWPCFFVTLAKRATQLNFDSLGGIVDYWGLYKLILVIHDICAHSETDSYICTLHLKPGLH